MFLIKASHKFEFWPSILALEGASTLYKANKHLITYSCHQNQHSSCGGVTIEKVCMGRHYDLSNYAKFPDALEISL